MHANADLSLVIACYNDGPILERNVNETLRVLDDAGVQTELIIVDDCSQDDTPTVIERLVGTHPHRRFILLRHARNLGRGRTVADGIGNATAPLVGFLDIDLEVHARFIPPCLGALNDGFDIATGFRSYAFTWRSADRYVMSRGYRLLMQKALEVPLNDPETGFKFFRRQAILPVLAQTRDPGWFWDTEIMVRAYVAGLRITEVPVIYQRQFERPSTVKPFRDSLIHLRRLSAFRREVRRLRKASRP
jgi:glycosyltransferase involved in cell wall biosynthesis